MHMLTFWVHLLIPTVFFINKLSYVYTLQFRLHCTTFLRNLTSNDAIEWGQHNLRRNHLYISPLHATKPSLPPPDKRYKAVLLFAPEKSEKEIRSNVFDLHSQLKRWKGSDISAIYNGRNELEYPIKKRTAARYVEISFRVFPTVIKYLHERLKQDPNIIRFLIIKPSKISVRDLEAIGLKESIS